jgi:hypothetical protein
MKESLERFENEFFVISQELKGAMKNKILKSTQRRKRLAPVESMFPICSSQ